MRIGSSRKPTAGATQPEAWSRMFKGLNMIAGSWGVERRIELRKPGLWEDTQIAQGSHNFQCIQKYFHILISSMSILAHTTESLEVGRSRDIKNTKWPPYEVVCI